VKKIQSELWQLTIPDSWTSESEDDMTHLYDPESSSGSLIISTIVEDEPISDDYIEELVAEHLDAGADLIHEVYGPFTGVGCCFELDDDYWCEWYLCLDNILLYITYNCDLSDEGEEDDLIDGILESLTLNTNNKTSLH